MTTALTEDAVNATAARLKASRDAHNVEATEAGKAHGIRWASQVATYHELKRLAHHCESLAIDDVAEFLFTSVRGIDPCCVCDDCHFEFDQELFGEDADAAQEDPWMREGFVKGALEVWDAVRPKV